MAIPRIDGTVRFYDAHAIRVVPLARPALPGSTLRGSLLWSGRPDGGHGRRNHAAEGIPLVFKCTVPAHPTVQLDDDRVRITRWDFEPGAATGWHEHALPYCIVMVLGGTLVVHDGEKETRVPLGAGDAYARPKGITHDVMNGSEHPVAFVEIEMKR